MIKFLLTLFIFPSCKPLKKKRYMHVVSPALKISEFNENKNET